MSITPMPPRLRDLIATLNRPPVADTELHRLATSFEPIVAELPAPAAAPHAQQVKRDIIAAAATAMVAQARLSKQSVLALLGDGPSVAPSN